MDYLIIPFLIYLLSSLFDMGLTIYFIRSPWQEGNPWIRFLIIHFGKWSLVTIAIIEAVIVRVLAHQLAKGGSRVLAFFILAVPVMIHVLAGLMWLKWTGLAGKVSIMQLQLLGVITMVIGLVTDLIVTRRKEEK